MLGCPGKTIGKYRLMIDTPKNKYDPLDNAPGSLQVVVNHLEMNKQDIERQAGQIVIEDLLRNLTNDSIRKHVRNTISLSSV